MNLRPSRVLGQLNAGNYPSILKINLSDPRVIEIAGLSGVDAVWLCTEHVPNDWIGLENQIRAARLHNIDSLVRVGRGSYSDYIRPLEADATGIIVPHVTTADEARQIVNWVRFHPMGRRALDGGNIDGRFCHVPMAEYLEHSNQERIIILQIESPEALANVEEIAAVPGFNGLLFGPGDFSHLIGKAGQLDAPEVVAARQRVAAAATAHGKFTMTAGLIAPFDTLVKEGYRLFGVGADVVGIGSYIEERLKLIKNPPAAPASSSSPYV
ncbi:HpcH/HpaI aldolase family protein [Actomonas aquatica]|uniref:Aldolase/citrate lyase family protein n=1 Tax=Actomonas aquatica TaxID=2866162 RepID=A0ABZ1C2E7_9BACT|nr:aldolase/citrate lyase family protein [Opitutus sp. WL0086]WRQ85520.1 aldolase/citrate lyase family protein [Opitutus sp. WL0086]